MDPVYVGKWWLLSSLIITPAFMALWWLFGFWDLENVLVMSGYNLLYTMPGMFAGFLAVFILRRWPIKPAIMKLLLNVIVLLGMAASFYAMGGWILWYFYWFYVISIPLASMMIRIVPHS